MIGLMGHQQQQQQHHHQGHQLHLPSFGRTKEGPPPPPPTPPPPPPKGCMAVRVGQEGEEQQRFVVPVVYLTQPLFLGLLKKAEEVYGFDHKGAISIPCHVEHFRQVLQGIIESSQQAHGRGKDHHHHHFHLASCFGGLKA